MQKYYKDPDVRLRMIEYLGGNTLNNATCNYLVRFDSRKNMNLTVSPPRDLPVYLDKCRDIGRSLWDNNSLIAHLEIEYIDFNFPARPYLEMDRSFAIQQPAATAVENILQKHGIKPLHLLSGRGHHFLWSIRQDSAAFAQFTYLGNLLNSTIDPAETPRILNKPVPVKIRNAHAGLGLIMEYIAYNVMKEAQPKSMLPVKLSKPSNKWVEYEKETVAIDISAYGYPLFSRAIRIPFSIYLKPWKYAYTTDQLIRGSVPGMVIIPVYNMSVFAAKDIMCDRSKAAELAKYTRTRIPDFTDETGWLLSDYKRSCLRKYHKWFYSEEHGTARLWMKRYKMKLPDALPAYSRHLLSRSDKLLKSPAAIEHIVRILGAKGWHPRHIAGLIISQYKTDRAPIFTMREYSVSMTVDFYVRIFARTRQKEKQNF